MQPVPGRYHIEYAASSQLAEFRLWLIRSHDAQGQGDGAAVGRKLLQSIAQNQHVRHMVAVQMSEQDSR